MRANAAYYKQFIDVHPGGGYRRNPKRKNAGSYSSPANFVPPSPADIDRVFENHLTNMARGGTWGDNMEISAFSSAMGYDVKIYQRDFAYMVSGGGEAGNNRPVAHIAYHMWEHYSSIRNLDGPHTGLPDVSPKVLSPEQERKQQEKLHQTPHVLPWQIDVVVKSLPFLADKMTVKRAIEAAKGDINLAVSTLLDAEENGSTSSYVESSSVERDHDSDEDADGPNKKQDRRMSRASRAQKERTKDSRHALSYLTNHDTSQESFASWNSEDSIPDSSQHSTSTQPTPSFDGNDALSRKPEQNHASDASTIPPKPVPRLKLLPPKPPAGKTSQKQPGPRVTARDRKDIKKQAQKAARKERQQAAAKGESTASSPPPVGITFRAKGMTGTPPVDTLRTLYI
jgi:hypothetical protein